MSTRRPKSVLDHDRYTAELSTGQLVIGVCILLMFGLGCFLLGILIGKFDPTLHTETARREAAPEAEASAPEFKISEGSPATTSSGSPASVAGPELPPEMRVPPRMLSGESPPAQATSTPSSRPAPPLTEHAPATLEAAPPTAAAADTEPSHVAESVQAAAERNRVPPPTAQPQPIDASAAIQPEVVPAQTSSSAAESSEADWKGYGVQIIAVSRPRADRALKDLESKTSYRARVLPHQRGELYRVVVGPYLDQRAALRARDDLRARGYRDAFVLTL